MTTDLHTADCTPCLTGKQKTLRGKNQVLHMIPGFRLITRDFRIYSEAHLFSVVYVAENPICLEQVSVLNNPIPYKYYIGKSSASRRLVVVIVVLLENR